VRASDPYLTLGVPAPGFSSLAPLSLPSRPPPCDLIYQCRLALSSLQFDTGGKSVEAKKSICSRCHRKLVEREIGTCEFCRSKTGDVVGQRRRSKRYRDRMSPDRREYFRALRAAYVLRRSLENKCRDCVSIAGPGKQRCNHHDAQWKAYQASWARKKRARVRQGR
jgi:hypothetical protein